MTENREASGPGGMNPSSPETPRPATPPAPYVLFVDDSADDFALAKMVLTQDMPNWPSPGTGELTVYQESEIWIPGPYSLMK